MKYLSVLGRQPKISLAELTSLYREVRPLGTGLATFESDSMPEINRLGGSLKIAQKIDTTPLDFLKNLPDGKITLGVSDYTPRGTKKHASDEALKLKRQLKKLGRSVRILPNTAATISTAAAHHNQLGEKPRQVELILTKIGWFSTVGVQNITAYTKRDQARPARDAKVGMLPPKLAQILINLCGDLPNGARILDPFCGTGVVLQEAALMGYTPYGTDLSERMTQYAERNLIWLGAKDFTIEAGDATTFKWTKQIDAVAAEIYLGPPMSLPPVDIKLKTAKQECQTILLGFLKNIAPQIRASTPLALGIPAWLRPDGTYSRLNILDEIEKLGYNVVKYQNLSQEDLLYHREGQVVAREIIVLRKA